MPINPSENDVITQAVPETQNVVKIVPSVDYINTAPIEPESGFPVLIPPTDIYNATEVLGLTEDDVIEIIRSENVFANYKLQDFDDGVPNTYVGNLKPDGTYLIQKIIDNLGDLTVVYANISNNPTQVTYSNAWANRVTLTYNLISNISGL